MGPVTVFAFPPKERLLCPSPRGMSAFAPLSMDAVEDRSALLGTSSAPPVLLLEANTTIPTPLETPARNSAQTSPCRIATTTVLRATIRTLPKEPLDAPSSPLLSAHASVTLAPVLTTVTSAATSTPSQVALSLPAENRKSSKPSWPVVPLRLHLLFTLT